MSRSRSADKRTRPSDMNAVMYIRVSSQEQEDEGYSTDAQERLIREYATKHGYRILRVFEDVETAKKAGRTEFGKMIAFVEEQGESCRNILVEKTDRVYRNLKDWVTIDELDVRLHLVKEGKIISREASSNDRFIHGIQVVMAKHYIDNLSEEVKKGMLEKARQGIYPSRAPLGYYNSIGPDRRKTISVHPEIGPIVRKCFEDYSTGSKSLEDVRYAAHVSGLRTKGGKSVGRSQIEHILKNEFYTGGFFWLGQRFKGEHDPLVTQELFDRVQAEFARRRNHHCHVQDRNHLYRGMLICGRCGHTMTGEEQKGIIYYHCTARARSGCREPYAREDKVDAAYAAALGSLRFDDEVFQWLRDALTTSKDEERRYREQQLTRLRQEVVKIQNRLDQVVDAKFDGELGQDEYLRLSNRYRKEVDEANAKIDAHLRADRSYVDLGVQLLDLVQKVGKPYLEQSPSERRRLASMVFSNCVWGQGKLIPNHRKPFDLLVVAKEKTAALATVKEPERALCPVWLPVKDGERAVYPVRPGRLHVAGRAWMHYRDRQPVLSTSAPDGPVPRATYLRRGWIKNPILVAMEMKAALDALDVPNHGIVAEQYGVTRARVTQYLALLRLPMRIVEFLADPTNAAEARRATEGNLRKIVLLRDPARQWTEFEALIAAKVDSDRPITIDLGRSPRGPGASAESPVAVA